MLIDVKIRGFEKNQSIMNNIISGMLPATEKILHEIGENIVYEAKHNIQQNQNINSGSLLASIKILDEGRGIIRVGSNLFYSWFIEFGRGPVRPVHAKMLHWVDKRTGKDVFSEYSGPTEPQPFLQPAVEQSIKDISGLYVDFVNSTF